MMKSSEDKQRVQAKTVLLCFPLCMFFFSTLFEVATETFDFYNEFSDWELVLNYGGRWYVSWCDCLQENKMGIHYSNHMLDIVM